MACSQARTLPELLYARAIDGHSTAQLSYLDDDGCVSRSLTYADLFRDATDCAIRLLAAGLTSGDVVLASFPDHQGHVLLFWACCLAGIPICPLPPPHPDPTRQTQLYNHLQGVFHGPTLIAPAATIASAHSIAPELKVLPFETLRSSSSGTVGDPPSSIFPSGILSPDDTACFMLTSGSTGNSKAVLLTHANLLSSVRGKIAHHGTSAASRFFNWIAFDHVACLSETHIHALAANASQWLIAPSAVIRTPRNLLKWISAFRVTYAFSPNFLLAQILRDVSSSAFEPTLDLTHLRAFISGGEAVPLTTAISFADLMSSFGAPRDALRAGFGMSETGAGCIYDRRSIARSIGPNSPMYLSLGTCCPGVRMRVVDPLTGTVRSYDEAGQLQIKGPTVFGKYYGNVRATGDSFTTDGWFITGDSALIDPDGNLFLVGRDKDCININGVKTPTQDVEHSIEDANIPGVIHGFVYVCPMRLIDADTESYAVFYQHHIIVEAGPDATQTQTIITANRAIAKVCTIFCAQAPHIVLPLPRASFVKTSLGKISRSQLAKAYLQGDFEALQTAFRDSGPSVDKMTSDLLSPVEKIVADCIASSFAIQGLALRRSLNIFDMGASSMHLIRLKQAIESRLSLTEIPTIELLKRPEIGELCDYLSQQVQANRDGKCNEVVYQPLVCFNSSGTKPPLFLVHPGVGEVLVFIQLARSLNDDRPVYALRARGFDEDNTGFGSFDGMVEIYAEAIERRYPNGPYYLAGYSFGAAVAFEIGKRLEARGREVPWLGIFNLPPDIQWRMKELTWAEVLLNIGMFLSLFPASSLDEMRNDFHEMFPEIAEGDAKPARPLAPVGWLFNRSDRARLHELNLTPNMLIRWVNVSYGLSYSARNFEPRGRVNGALTTVFCAIPLPSMGSREEYKRNRLSTWQKYSGNKFELIDVDGEHYTMLSEKHVESFARHLRGALKRADERRVQ